MIIYGVSNLINDQYNTIQQISTNPNKIDWCLKGHIIWYKEWNTDEHLNTVFSDIAAIQRDNWKIWKCSAILFNSTYAHGLINYNGKGVIELDCKQGSFVALRYWFNKEDYLQHKNPDLIKQKND